MVARFAAVLGLLMAAGSGCIGGGEGDVPRGSPEKVIELAPDRTRGEGSAEVAVSDGRREDVAVVDLARPSGPIGSSVGGLLALVEDAVKVESFGGQQVRGTPAFRYDVVVRRAGDDETIGVWVDRIGRIRRIQVRSLPPATVRGGLPRLTIVDFLVFGADASATTTTTED